MCGIAGIIDLVGRRPAPEGVVQRMARAIIHRGPDEEGFLERPGISLASRRLSIVGLADGQQPMTNEDHSVFVVFNGELFDYVERREELVARPSPPHPLRHGNHPAPVGRESGRDVRAAARTICDRPVGCAAPTTASRPRSLRDRSALLDAAGRLAALRLRNQGPACLRNGSARPDRGGLDHIFTFSAMPGPMTCFEGVQLLPQDTTFASPREVEHAVRSLPNGPTGKWIFRTRATRTGNNPQRSWMNSSDCS